MRGVFNWAGYSPVSPVSPLNGADGALLTPCWCCLSAWSRPRALSGEAPEVQRTVWRVQSVPVRAGSQGSGLRGARGRAAMSPHGAGVTSWQGARGMGGDAGWEPEGRPGRSPRELGLEAGSGAPLPDLPRSASRDPALFPHHRNGAAPVPCGSDAQKCSPQNELKLSVVALKEAQESLKTKVVDSPEKLKNYKEKMKGVVQKLKDSRVSFRFRLYPSGSGSAAGSFLSPGPLPLLQRFAGTSWGLRAKMEVSRHVFTRRVFEALPWAILRDLGALFHGEGREQFYNQFCSNRFYHAP